MVEVFGDVDYGGRVTDDRDKRTLAATLSPLLTYALMRPLAAQPPAEHRSRRADSTASDSSVDSSSGAPVHDRSHLRGMIDGHRPWGLDCFLPPPLFHQNPLQVCCESRFGAVRVGCCCHSVVKEVGPISCRLRG